MYLLVPLASPPRPFAAHGVLGAVLDQERVWDSPACSFPSFHVIWAFIAADAWASRMPRRRLLWRLLACLVAVSCVTTGMHAIIDVAGGLVAFGLVARHDVVWRVLRDAAERVANSWREVRLGPVRLINHGGWAALGTFGGVAAIGALIGPANIAAILIAATASLLGAALWAQMVEGSPSLSRPYGFYGGVLGVVVGSLAAPLVGTPVWPLLAACTIVGPWVQACGRLRCLVQGCCHGRETSPTVGIRYDHPRSRVVRLANLADVPIHPTPLYSILWNVVTALVVVRLWSLHARWHLIGGVYLILNGLGRFVEEAFRGEPQTPTVARLRLYQWTAVASVVAGALVTALGKSAQAPVLQPNLASLIAAAAFAVVTWAALGLDFPESGARSSRLA
jgi:prolipoprotein diacylglyceryltransferase